MRTRYKNSYLLLRAIKNKIKKIIIRPRTTHKPLENLKNTSDQHKIANQNKLTLYGNRNYLEKPLTTFDGGLFSIRIRRLHAEYAV